MSFTIVMTLILSKSTKHLSGLFACYCLDLLFVEKNTLPLIISTVIGFFGRKQIPTHARKHKTTERRYRVLV